VAAATAVAVAAASVVASAAIAIMTVASAAATAACVYILSVKSLCEFLLGSLSYCKHLTLEVKGLACHLVVEVHLHAIFRNLYYYAWDYAAHAVHHRNGVAHNEEVLADLAVNLKRCLWKIDHS
jgi:hypothetical protein